MGADTICRVEQQMNLCKEASSAVEAINDILNPYERIEKRLTEIERKIAVAEGTKKPCVNKNNDPSLYDISPQNAREESN
jgi:hypothetical protein